MQRSRTDMYTQYVAPASWSARERHARAAHHLKAWPLRQLVHAPQHRIVVSMPCRRFSFAASPSGGCGLAGTDRPCMHVLSKYRRRTGPADTYTAVPVDFQGVGGGGSGTFWTSLCRRSSDHPEFRLCTHTHSACRVACGKMPISTSWLRNCAAASVCVA